MTLQRWIGCTSLNIFWDCSHSQRYNPLNKCSWWLYVTFWPQQHTFGHYRHEKVWRYEVWNRLGDFIKGLTAKTIRTFIYWLFLKVDLIIPFFMHSGNQYNIMGWYRRPHFTDSLQLSGRALILAAHEIEDMCPSSWGERWYHFGISPLALIAPQFKHNLMAVQLNVTLESDNVHVIATGKNYIIGRRNYVNIWERLHWVQMEFWRGFLFLHRAWEVLS